MALTISSTVRHACAADRLAVVGQELLDEDEEAVCTVYGTRTFVDWRDGSLPYYEGNDRSDFSPDEEVDSFLREFMLGGTAGIVTRLTPTRRKIWEVRLEQTRIFGWFESPGHLILHVGDAIENVKDGGVAAYDAAMDDVENERSRLAITSVGGDILHVRSYAS